MHTQDTHKTHIHMHTYTGLTHTCNIDVYIHTRVHIYIYVYICYIDAYIYIYICVCVCERVLERDIKKGTHLLPPCRSGIQPFMQIKLPRISQLPDELSQLPKYQRPSIIRRLWPDVRFQLLLFTISFSNDTHILVHWLHANNQRFDDPSSKSKIATGQKHMTTTMMMMMIMMNADMHKPKHTASHTHTRS